MKVMKSIIFCLVLLYCHIRVSNGQNCSIRNETFGKIIHSSNYSLGSYQNCWIIRVPRGSYLRLNLTELNPGDLDCGRVNLTVQVNGTKQVLLCSRDENRRNVISIQDVKIVFNVYNYRERRTFMKFGISFIAESLMCKEPDSFRCSYSFCIPRWKVCDGIEDCENGADEKGCDDHGLEFNYYQLRKSIIKGISWLKSKRNADFGWTDNTHRAVIALYLSQGANFNGTDLIEELTAKQLEFELAIALLRNSTYVISPNYLSIFINALLAICRDPQHFYGYNLIQLVTEMRNDSQLVHPGVYLAICNANGTLPNEVTSQLVDIFKKKLDTPFLIDTKAMAVMAASCIKERKKPSTQNFFNGTGMNDDKTFENAYNSTIRQLQDLQQSDGSFGNVYTTALISQALLSSKKEYRSEMVINAAVKYLVKELNKTSLDFLTVYWSLPVLLNRSLTDLSKVNCFDSSRRNKEVEISAIKDKLGAKMRVQYSLYIGDDNDITHTIYFRVAENSTPYEVMQLAQSVDSKYKFEAEKRYGRLHIYKIGSYTNDPENGKFWSFYYKSNVTGANPLLKSIDDFVLKDGDQMIMWFRTAAI